MRSKSKNRNYTNARAMVDKRAAGFTAPYLKLPEGAQLFKPKAGVMLLDILPFPAGKGNPWAEEGALHWERTFWVHRGVGANSDSYLCLRKNANKPCPICEYRAKLEKENDDATEELRKSLAPKERQLFNVINRKDPEKGVQLWDFSYHMFGKLLQARIRDSDEDDGWDLFFSLEQGLTLKIGFGEKAYAGRAYFEAETIDFKSRSEPYDEEILEQVHCLDDLLVLPDYEKLKSSFLESAEDEPAPTAGRKKSKASVDDDDDDQDDDDEDDVPPKRSAKPPVDDEDDDDADDDDDAPAPKKKTVSAADKDDEDEDDADDSDDEDEDEKPAPKKKGKAAKDDDDDFDDFDDDEDEKPAPKKGKKVEKDDEDDDDADDDEDEKPKKHFPRGGKFASADDDDSDDDEDDEEPAPKKKGRR